ncbi:MAG: hypothetical protein PVJ51_02920 [Acidobacteriota bacterium]|jgi:hypothetical protein
MRRIAFLCAAACVFAGAALAQQSPEMQQKIAAARQAAAQNQQALHTYSWVSTTQILVKGDVKDAKVEQCQYATDGTVQKTELSDSQAQQQEQQSSRRRRGRVKESIVKKKTGEMQEEMKSAAALVESYVPPSSDRIQAVVAAKGVSLQPDSGGQAVLTFANYQKSGDSLTLTLDTTTHALVHVSVDTYLDDPSKKVTLDVTFESLPDGTSYPATTVLAIPGDQIEVHIANSNYEKLSH